jgi:hypothetical protein
METVFGYFVEKDDVKTLLYNDDKLYNDVKMFDGCGKNMAVTENILDEIILNDDLNAYSYEIGAYDAYHVNSEDNNGHEGLIIVCHQADSHSIYNKKIKRTDVMLFCTFIKNLFDEKRIKNTELNIYWV